MVVGPVECIRMQRGLSSDDLTARFTTSHVYKRFRFLRIALVGRGQVLFHHVLDVFPGHGV